jgi:solute carrier family 25 protein 42
MFCGACAGTVSVVCTYPLDMIRARMAMQFHKTEYHNWRHAVRVIYKEEGFAALFAGMGPTILGIIPYAGISFYTYETLKEVVRDHFDVKTTPPIFRIASGAVAGLVGQTLTYPLDITRRRMQTAGFLHTQQFGVTKESSPRSFVQTFRSMLREDPSGRIFFKGMSHILYTWFIISHFSFLHLLIHVHVHCLCVMLLTGSLPSK